MFVDDALVDHYDAIELSSVADAAVVAVTPEVRTTTPRRRRRDRLVPSRLRRQQQQQPAQRVVSLEAQAPRGTDEENPLFGAASEMVSVALAAVGVNLCALVFQPTSEHREVLGDRWKVGHGLVHVSTAMATTTVIFCLVVRERAALSTEDRGRRRHERVSDLRVPP
ncbi:hypothetical protein G6O67_008418 [Ophiocordyceps sinensis]|uniref:Uncharacterized protein n=1 Tax=Ophiocordyceps sinensis TaxID=72228 RepID=A0A8H4LSP5_9HYPO|nr:hypothetical protein G6O67_008418 [Ophiocordyceps sinensis]